ncbi:MAG: hypothetical protein JJ837_08145 [Prochlorococcus marinus XMU1428]|nr:hypothetical protein [Prochlorococcus marinus XMU1428]
MTKISQKRFYFFLFYLLGLLNINSYGEEVKTNEVRDLKGKLVKKYSPTTSIKGSLFFTLGGVSESTSTESLHLTYENKLRINTSFTGNDNLLTIIESGNAKNSPLNLDLQSKKGDELKLSTIYYRFKLDDQFEATIGPKMFGYHGLAGKSTAYNERIAILDGSNYTTASGVGPGVAISKKNKNGFNSSLKIASNSSQMKNESLHYISQIGLTKKYFGGTITTNLNNEFNSYGFAAFYKPNNLPSISASIEYKDDDSIKLIKNWIFGIQKNLKNQKVGLAIGTHNAEEKIGYEVWSEFKKTDKLKLIPVLFIRENNSNNHELGLSLNTKFSY